MNLFLRINDPEYAFDGTCHAQWQLCDEQGSVVARSPGAQLLDEITRDIPPAPENGDRRIIVLLPGYSVMTTRASVPGQHARHFHRAAAYAVEEQLAEPVEEVHIAVGNAMQSGGSPPRTTYNIAIIRDAWMRGLMRQLETSGLRPDTVTSEALLLPCEPGNAFLLLEDGHIVFRFSDTLASALEWGMFLTFLDRYLTQVKTPHPGIDMESVPAFHALHLWTAGKIGEAPPDFMEPLRAICEQHGIAINLHHTESDAFDWLCGCWAAEALKPGTLNLLQGAYLPKDRSTSFPSRKAVAAILAVWFVLQAGFNLGAAAYFNYRAGQFHAQSEAIYHQLFPGDTKIVDLKTQFAQHLSADAAAGDGEGLIALLRILADGMTGTHRPQIETLQYDKGKNELVADMIADDFTVLESFKRQNADVTMGSATQDEKGVHGRVSIHGSKGSQHD